MCYIIAADKGMCELADPTDKVQVPYNFIFSYAYFTFLFTELFFLSPSLSHHLSTFLSS